MALIVDALATDLGRTMARASVEGIAARLGLKAPLTRDEQATLLRALSPGLAVFVGKAAAEQTLFEVHVRLGLGGVK